MTKLKSPVLSLALVLALIVSMMPMLAVPVNADSEIVCAVTTNEKFVSPVAGANVVSDYNAYTEKLADYAEELSVECAKKFTSSENITKSVTLGGPSLISDSTRDKMLG